MVLIPKPIKPKWPRGYVPKSHYARIWYSRDSIPVLDLLGRAAASKVLSFASPLNGYWLDVGCGPGGLLPSICSHAELAIGLDVNKEMAADAASLTRSMYGASCVIRGSAYAMPFRNSSFDGIIAMETMEHLESRNALREITRVLKPRGKLVLSVPVETGSALILRQLARWFLHRRNPSFSPATYPSRDFARMVLGEDRALHRDKRVASLFDHLYFSWRVLLEEIQARLTVQRIGWSPLPFPGPWTLSVVVLATNERL